MGEGVRDERERERGMSKRERGGRGKGTEGNYGIEREKDKVGQK
jgi:hypothetical protein